ncbi:MAG TPA: VWA domain-containing protein [Pyrinomonadaceae bacterium]|jgi:VWFA-related protein
MFEQRFFLKHNMASLSWCWLVIVCICLCAAQARAQEGKEAQKGPAEDNVEVLRVKSSLVNIEAMVKDKKGKYITDLKASDFTVFENGVRQEVKFFEPPLMGDTKANAPSAEQPGTNTSGVAPRNIISLVLDGQTTDLSNLKQVRAGIIKYLREQIADTDTVALFAITSELRLLQPFTQDKTKLIVAIEKAYSSSNSSKNFEQRDIAETITKEAGVLQNSGGATPGSITTQASGSASAQAMIAARVLQQFVKLRSVLSVQQSRPIIAALAAICEAQRAVPGKKTLVLFSQGFVIPATLDWQVQSAIDIANRANVAIYVIDSAGLKASAPQYGGFGPSSPLGSISAITSQEQRIQAVGGETVFDYARQEGPNRGYDILYRISGDTGGQFIKNTNDIAKGLNRIDQEIRARYTLAYHSTDPNFDGGFRKLKIEIHNRADAQVVFRNGYYALAHDEVISISPEDKRLLATIAAAKDNPGLPLFLELPAFRFKEGRYIIPLSIEMPTGAVRFDRKNDRQLMQLDVLGVVREKEDKILSRLGGNFNVGLTIEQYKAIQNNNIFYRQDIELAPGTYTIDLIVKDKLSGKMAARMEKLILPIADSDFTMSGIVLSRHVEFAPQPLAGGGAIDVLSFGSAQIRPSTSREFYKGDKLIIFFNIYNAALSTETGKPHVKVNVRLMRENKIATRPSYFELTETLDEPTPHLTFSKYLSLGGLPLGRYTAKIEARDMVTGNLINQQAAFVITR